MSQHRKIKPVTEEEYMKCNEWNRTILEEFLMQPHFSPDTVKQYRSSGKIFLRFIYDRFQNKEIFLLKARNGMLYQTWLNSIGLSSSAIRLRRSLVSTLCNYIELYYGDENDDLRAFRNIFPKGVAHVPHNLKNEKTPLTLDEWNHLIKTLDEREEYQMKAYALLSFESGARRSEISQIQKECAYYEPAEGSSRYATHLVRGKGRGEMGKQYRLLFGEASSRAMKEWLKYRGEDSEPALFVRKTKQGKVIPLSREAFNEWCSNTFSEILQRNFSPHDFRRSRATLLSEQGVSIDQIKRLLQHESSETTATYILTEEDDDMDDLF